jgi:EF hand
MRIRLNLLTLLGLGLLAWPAMAQPPERPAGDPPPSDPAMKQKLLDAFDTNNDGTIDRAEARAIGRALRENFDIGPGPGGRGQGGPPPAGGPAARGPEGRRGPGGPPPENGAADRGPDNRRGRGQDGRGPNARGPAARGPDDRGPQGRGRGPGGPDNPPPPPRPERLFNRFDENKDGSLSKDEFMKLSDFMRENRPPGPPMMGRGGQGRGFDGPPQRDGDSGRRGGEGRRRWRDGPPPGSDGPPADDDPKDAI